MACNCDCCCCAKCYTCGGTGGLTRDDKARVTCPTCSGSGKRRRYYHVCPNDFYTTPYTPLPYRYEYTGINTTTSSGGPFQ